MELIKPNEISDISSLQFLINKELDNNLYKLNNQLKDWYGQYKTTFIITVDNERLQYPKFFNFITLEIGKHLEKAGWRWKRGRGDYVDYIIIYHPDYKSRWQKFKEWFYEYIIGAF